MALGQGGSVDGVKGSRIDDKGLRATLVFPGALEDCRGGFVSGNYFEV